MKKIKFKIEYVPLSDAQIERHKDFDGLMAAFAAHPKPTFKERLKSKLLGNKFLVYMGGIITGAMLTSAIWWGVNSYNVNEKISQHQTTPKTEDVRQSVSNESVAKNKLEQSENSENKLSSSENNITAKQNSNSIEKPGGESENAKKNALTIETTKLSTANSANESATQKKSSAQSKKNKSQKTQASLSSAVTSSGKSSTGKKLSGNSSKKSPAANSASQKGLSNSEQKTREEFFSQSQNGNQYAGHFEQENISSLNLKSVDTLTLNSEFLPPNIHEPSLSILHSDSSKKKFQLNLPKIDVAAGWTSTKNSVSKFGDSVGSKTSGFFSKLFSSDSSKKEEYALAHADSIDRGEDSPSADTFKHRFAQVCFVTPLGSDGVNGGDYEHNLSLNILQGYSGALNGVEFGGLANVEKGYVKGAQFGGLVNFAFGDVSGAQFGGLVNNGNNLNGFQAAGILNSATGTMNGFQAGGVANFAADSMHGLQAAGVLNLSTSNKRSGTSWQIAGVSNISLGKTTGGQISGVYNGAMVHKGVQIATVNFAKKISGFQLGVINIADSIDGESIGLINIYRNGIHNADVFGSEILYFNAGLKLGSPHIYTEFAFGVTPYKDLTRMGLGIGIGGHIPVKKGFVNIDGMCWSIHNDSFNDWNNINLWNQIRFMYGYQITKGVAIYAGPTLNAQVYDLSYPSVAPYTIYSSTGSPTRVDGWIGGVIGLQFF